MPHDPYQRLFAEIAAYASRRRAEDAERHHAPSATYGDQVADLRLDLSQPGAASEEVIRDLIRLAEPGLAAITAPRFFGWVMGASNPTGVAADWLTSIWGQNAGNHMATPAAAAVETVSAEALLDLLDLPREASVGFVTGATMASYTCLAAARSEVLRRVHWNLEADGMAGSPPIAVVLGEEAHSTIYAGLKYLGIGERRLVRVATDANGAIIPEALDAATRALSGPMIVIGQAGHINSGAFDDFGKLVSIARAKGAWLHIDGAFGLWARATKTHRHLTEYLDLADSWSVDGHKWLQTPYDCAYAIVKDRRAHVRAMQIAASYLPASESDERIPADLVPELSRRARGFATWAMIRHLGRRGIADLVSHHCALARLFADRLAAAPGVSIENDVVLNQVAVHFGTDTQTQAVIAAVQSGGECFVAGAQWRGKAIMRISVTNENTTEADIERSAAAILAAWRSVRGAN